MQVEHVAGVGLAAWRATKQEGHLPVRPGVFREVVVNDQGVLALEHEVLAHRAPGVWGEVLDRRRVRGVTCYHNGVLHSPVFFKDRDGLGHLACLLSDSDVDAGQVAAFLVDDRINRDHRLACGTVADDQLSLAAPDRDHGVDGLDACLYGRVDCFADGDVRCDHLYRPELTGLYRSFAVQRLSEGVHDAAD
jgi:hypothetical protein